MNATQLPLFTALVNMIKKKKGKGKPKKGNQKISDHDNDFGFTMV